MLPDLAARGHVALERATAVYDSVYRTGRMAGASLAGVLILGLGPVSLLVVDGGTFLVSAVLVGSSVPRITRDGGGSAASGYLARLREGMGFLWRDQVLRGIIVILLVSNMLDTGLSQVLLPAYAKETARDPRVLGLLIGAVGAGALAGTLVYGAIGARLPPRATFAVAMLLGGAPRPLVLAAGAPFGVALAVMAISGFACGAVNPLMGVIQFARIPGRLRARVLGASTACAYAGMPLGGLLAGFLAAAASLRATLVTFAVIYLLVSVPPFLGRSWKTADFAAAQPQIPAKNAAVP
jgi:predicted MFS family arabinose efflux permease